ncbi:MAG: antitoxin family protein [Acidobacteria bacterium]|nr:antitoxin family protein [Acidobacteriota bacterium]
MTIREGSAFRARVKDGKLEPLEKIDLPEGKAVEITVMRLTEERDDEAFLRSAGGWKGLIDADKLIDDIYNDRLMGASDEPES